jgi:two-component system, NtrC family, response regulator AtoC
MILTRTPDANSSVPQNGSARRRVLIVEDNDLARKQMQTLLADDDRLEIEALANGKKALDRLTEQRFSIVLTDLRLPGADGMDLIQSIQDAHIPVTVIVMTAFGSVDEAVKAMRLGAYDFLTKPIDLDHLRLVIERALRERGLEDEVAQLRAQLEHNYSFQNVLSKCPRMHAIFELISNIGSTNTTVLIEGETGTGKEKLAHAIHQCSVNRPGPMVAVNCAALPENLLESELFGHEKGAFTSAVGQRKGRFEIANTGTVFLDEIGDVPATMQAKLLRVLQERSFERVGGTESIEVDVRVIAATNRSLLRLVRKGQFREDLYYRLNVVRLELPPLRERREDILLLAAHFAKKFARPGQPPKELSPQAAEVLLNYGWPGNIRELENVIERACVTTREPVIDLANLPQDLIEPSSSRSPFDVDLARPLPEVLREATSFIERQYLRKALKKVRGSVVRCARVCGLSRRSVTAKIAEYKIDRSEFRDD